MPQGFILAEALDNKNAVIFSDALLKLPVASFDCKNSRMNRDMQDAMGAGRHPEISIRLLNAQNIDSGTSQPDKISVEVEITLNGVKKQTEVLVDLERYTDTSYYIREKSS
jgi:hypothetical protein